MPNTLTTPSTAVRQVFADAMDALDRADSSSARVRAAAESLHAIGFHGVNITLRDASFNVTLSVVVGSANDTMTRNAMEPQPAAVWRRRMTHLERFRVEELYFLDGSDAWVAREFFAVEPTRPALDSRWLPTDLLIGLLRGARQELLGVVTLAAPHDGQRPTADLSRDVASIVRQLASRLAYDALQGLAQRRAERGQLHRV